MDSQYSQIGGRLGGNIKKWPNYIPPYVQTTENIDEAINIQRNMTEWLKEQNKITIDSWTTRYNKECRELGIREGKTHKFGTYVFKFNSVIDLKKFILLLNTNLREGLNIRIKGPTKVTIYRERIDGHLPFKWDYIPKLAVRNEDFIYDKKQLRQGFYKGSFDDQELSKVKSKKAGRAIPYYDKDGKEMWCFVTPEKYYMENIKKYNDKIITYCSETKQYKINTYTIIPAFK